MKMLSRVCLSLLIVLLGVSPLYLSLAAPLDVPVVTPGSDPAATLLAYAKYRNFTTENSWEVYQGLDAATGSNSDVTWDSQNSLAFSYDPVADKFTTVVTNTIGTWSIDYLDYSTQVLNVKGELAYSYLSALNYLQFRITVHNNPSTVMDFLDVTLDGHALGDFHGVPDSALDWMVTEYDLSAGFTLTGTISVSGIATNSPEKNKVELYFGHIEYQGPVVTNLTANPNPVGLSRPLQVEATLDDASTGNALVTSAEFSLDSGATWQPLDAVDGTYDESLEDVSAETTSPTAPGSYDLCVRGWDADGYVGETNCTQLEVDGSGPVTTNLVTTPDPVDAGQPLTVSGTISDTATGGSNVLLGEYSLDGGAIWAAMEAQDGTYDDLVEAVEATFAAPDSAGMHEVCVRGQDVSGNTGSQVCAQFSVAEPEPEIPYVYVPIILVLNH